MTVKELIEQLEKFDENKEICVRGPQYRASEYYINNIYDRGEKSKIIQIFLV